MTYALLLSDTFKSNLSQEMEHLSSCISLEKAQATLRSILERIGLLKEFPYAGVSPLSLELRNCGLRVLVFDHYLVFYKVNETAKAVILMFFVPAKSNYLWQIRP
jgi:plasmid stabilization system protein ParE